MYFRYAFNGKGLRPGAEKKSPCSARFGSPCLCVAWAYVGYCDMNSIFFSSRHGRGTRGGREGGRGQARRRSLRAPVVGDGGVDLRPGTA